MQELVTLLETASSWQDAKRIVERFQAEHRNIRLFETSKKGVAVTPLHMSPLTFDNGKINVEAEPSFITNLQDLHNVPRAMEVNVTGAKKFYVWLSAHFAEVQDLDFSSLLMAMRKAGIPVHSYASMS